MDSDIRVRFAPSPTGGLHIGGVRTALYNYLFARKHKGRMVLRIEDTDRNRLVQGAEEYITESLAWCGIDVDESPSLGGPFGPYRQSERLDLYTTYVDQLLKEGKAYYAFDTPKELADLRNKLHEKKSSVQHYGMLTRMDMNNSLSLSEEEVNRKIASGQPYVVRLLVPEGVTVFVNDLIRGQVKVSSDLLDDKILLKSDGFPTYHLANVVDDHLMKISHVIRGEEWLPSAPLHALLYQLLGWKESQPGFAHLPLLLKPEGTGKLSKRDAAKHGFPIFPISWNNKASNEIIRGFRESGYLPDALVNFLALLGWNPGGDQEIFSMDQLIREFSLERIGKAGATFDINKLKWFNEHYLRNKPLDELADSFKHVAEEHGQTCSSKKALSIVSSLIDRVSFPDDFWNQGAVFFVSPTEYNPSIVRKKWTIEAGQILSAFSVRLPNQAEGMAAEDIKQLLWEEADQHGLSLGKVMPALRIALTGGAGGPDLITIIQILGTNETKERIQSAVQHLTK